ncbi:MAG: hypothetical protein K2O67_06465, partial [Clostridia bacterium]|nr:hypothetical protein [Clostridia bacterium]
YEYTATSDGSNKFEMLTTGALKQYIVTPSQVSWQKNANRMKNDPEWAANSYGHYTQRGWLNDKIWLPSMYEVYDSTIPANSELDYINRKNKVSGLWNTSVIQRANNDASFTRSSNYDYFNTTFVVESNGADNDYYYSQAHCAVRPALHLNLSKAVENAETHTHSMTKTDAVAAECTTPGNKAYWQCSICNKYFSDEVGITEVELESTVIAATGHDYASAWTTDGSNHWHVCNNGCGVKDSDGEHTGGTATCTQKATCTVCSTQYGELAAHDLVHHEAKSPKCTEVGWNAYDTCNNCDYTTYVEIAATGHTKSDWIVDDEPTCTEEGTKHKECTVCHTSLETGTIDMIPHTPGDAATCTTAQTCTKCSAVIKTAKGHDYAAAWTTDGTNHWHVCNNGC